MKRSKKAGPAQLAQEIPKVHVSVNMPLDLATLLSDAAITRGRRQRQANLQAGPGRRDNPRPSSRPSVSQIVVEILERHRTDLERMAKGEA